MKTGNKAVRVRFAPSPTGHLHIGSLRTALFNWLFARHHDGIFLVRIEDTDTERSKPEYTDAIIQALDWMGLAADEQVVYQSARFGEHTKLIDQLIAQGKAYKDYYTQDELFALHKQQMGTAEFAKAYRVCRDQPQKQSKPYVVRFKLPFERTQVCFDDAIRGQVCVDVEQLDDFVIARSDGRPMYNFVVVADDIDQGITHVVRGEDHISNTPKQLLLYEALGKQPPIFAHLPLILGKEGQRLSKRDAATATEEYKELGYLPDALLNYLVRLGWAHGDQEIFTRDELIKLFSLGEVGKKGAMFDQEKLDWINAYYIRHTGNENLFDMLCALQPNIEKGPFNKKQLLDLIELYKERSVTLIELAQAVTSFAHVPHSYDEAACAKWIDKQTAGMLNTLIGLLDVEPFDVEQVKKIIAAYAKEHDKKLGAVAQPIRIALVGGSSSPSVFELLAILGKAVSQARLKRLAVFLQQRS